MKIIQQIITLSLFFSQTIVAEESTHVWGRIGPQGGGIDFFIESPNHPDTIYTVTSSSISSTAEQYLKSNNAGASWVTIPFTRNLGKFPIQGLAISASNPHTLFATSYDQTFSPAIGVLLKSTDAGVNWYQIAENISDIDSFSFISLNPVPDQSLQILMRKDDFQELGMAVSDDDGEKWVLTDKKISLINGNQASLIARDHANPDILYGSYYEGLGRTVSYTGLYKSINGGGNWSKISPSDFRIFNLIISSDNSNKLYAQFLQESPYKLLYMLSVNGGLSWEPLGDVPSDNSIDFAISNIFVDPSNSNILYASLFPEDRDFFEDPRFQRIAKSIDLGKSWKVIDISPYRVQSISINSGNNQKLLMATQSRGVISSEDGGLNWHPSNTGIRFVGGDLVEAKDDNSVLYFKASFVGTYYKSVDAGLHWEEFQIKIQHKNIDVVCDDIVLNPKQNKEIICKTGYALFKSNDAGVNWELIYEDIESLDSGISQFIFTMDGTSLYIVINGVTKSIIKSLDNGVTWNMVSNLAGDLIPHPEKTNILYNIADVDGKVALYKSTNGGESWIPLINSIHTFDHKLLIHPANSERLIFEDGGKTYLLSDDGGENWREILEPFNKDNQNTESSSQFVNITDLAFNPASLDSLIAVTEKGTFESPDLGESWIEIIPRFKEPLSTYELDLKATLSGVYAFSDNGVFKLINKPGYEEASNCLFEWAEQQYPGLFSPALSSTNLWGGYNYRYYSGTNTYLGFFHEQEVHMLQLKVSTDISTHGSVEFYMNLAGCD